LSHGLAIATLNGRGFAGPNIFVSRGTENPRAVLRAFPRVAGTFPDRYGRGSGRPTEAAGAQLVA
jgi:hypothetical protein